MFDVLPCYTSASSSRCSTELRRMAKDNASNSEVKASDQPQGWQSSAPDELRKLVEALAASIETQRRDDVLNRQLFEKALGMLEERLVRVENSVVFRFNR